MLEVIYAPAMWCFVAAMLFCAVSPRVHTGTLGALGCVVMAFAAGLATDTAGLASVAGTMRVMMIMCAGVGCVVGNFLWRVYGPGEHPRRRSTDVGGFDDQAHHHAAT